MNPLSKLFCRVFQAAFRIALPFLPYREPKVYAKIDEIPKLLLQLNKRSVLLVTDSFLRSSGATAHLEAILAHHGIACHVYDGTHANPTVANVEQAKELFVNGRCDCLIAFGGGSSMDCAKAVGARIAYPKKSLADLGGILRVLRKIPTLIAIPTTAGTGSETTLAAVITDTERHHKYTINSFPLIPSYAILDPKITYTLPPPLTATTGMDALTHAVEAYIGRSTNRKTRAWALEATRLVFENIETAYGDGENKAARAGMLRAAHLAGNAFTRSYVGYIHAVAHSLGGQYNIPHGLANSVLLPIVLKQYGRAVHQKLKHLAIAAGVATENDLPTVAAEKFIAAIEKLNENMQIPKTLMGICAEDIPQMARHAHREANPLYPVPVLMDSKELAKFYTLVSGG